MKKSNLSYFITIIILCSVSFSPLLKLGSLGLRIDDILVPVFGFYLIISNSYVQKQSFKIIRYFSYYLIFLTFSSFYGFLSFQIEPRINDFFELFRLIKYVFIILIVFNSNEDFFIKKFEKWMLICVAVLIFISYVEFYNFLGLRSLLYNFFGANIDKYMESSMHRNLGSSGNPNDFASVLVIFFLYVLQNVIDNAKRLFYVLCLIFLFHSILLTGSRTGFIALVIGSAYLIAFSRRIPLIKKTIIFFIIFLIGSAAISILSFFKQSILELLSGQSTSMNARYLIWGNVLNYIKSSPWVGYGTSKDFMITNQLLTDNEYLMIVLKTGVIGFFVYFYNYLKAFLHINKRAAYLGKSYFINFINSIFLISIVYMYTSSWFFSYKSFVLFILLYAISVKHYLNNDASFKK